jgi:K+-transporting ATPase KdpF subunit
MSGLYVVSLVLAGLLLGYLAVALLWPERFS